ELCCRDPSLGFLPRLNGMFAFALWDGRARTLTLARDRTGVKPLLYARIEGGLAFGSEMNALWPALGELSINSFSVAELLTLGFIGAPDTIFEGVRKLEPGHLLRWRPGGYRTERWAPQPPAAPLTRDIGEARVLLRDSVRRAVVERLVADVP